MTSKIGFMQGRLSPVVDGKIQSFPWANWENEFALAKEIGLSLMEWTLDQDRLYENPLMTIEGQEAILDLCKRYDFSIPSLTGDCFMQAPFWKAGEQGEREKLEADFVAVLKACNRVGISLVVVPLVDGGSLDNVEQENCLVDFLLTEEPLIQDLGIRIVFESDFEPSRLYRFISRMSEANFGINYDIGNSAALGANPVEEFHAIGDRILNVHVKDRLLNGTTVPLGEGAADFPLVFELLQSHGYASNYILQTARARDGSHSSILSNYRKFVSDWVEKRGS